MFLNKPSEWRRPGTFARWRAGVGDLVAAMAYDLYAVAATPARLASRDLGTATPRDPEY